MRKYGNTENAGNAEMQKCGKYGLWECGLWENADYGNVDGRGFNLCVVPSLRNLVSVISELRKDFGR